MASRESTEQTQGVRADGAGQAPAVAPDRTVPFPDIAPHFKLSQVSDMAGDGAEALTLQEATGEPSPGRRRHIVRLLVLVALAALIAVALWAYYAGGWRLPWGEESASLTASGTLEADEVLIAPEVAGRIMELAQEGQSVEADGVLARLDDSLIQVQITQATLAARQQLEVQAARYLLRSPISGVVTRVPMHIGEVVTPGQTVAAVANLTTLDLTAYVVERDLGSVRIGQQVAVTVDPFPGRVFRGVVTSTNPRAEFTPRNVQTQADRLNLVFGVKIRVDNPDLALKPGMPADVSFVLTP